MVNISYAETAKRYRSNDNNNNINVSGSEFRTISLGIHSELAKLRSAVQTRDKGVQRVQMTFRKETALDIARQITSLSPDPLFITVGNNGSDMCVESSSSSSSVTKLHLSRYSRDIDKTPVL